MTSATAEAPKVEEPKRWAMPKPYVGQQIIWFDRADAGQKGVFGYVTEPPGSMTIRVLIFTPGGNQLYKEGVHHMSDPGLTNPDYQWRDNGGWDFNPQDEVDRKFRTDVLARLSALEVKAAAAPVIDPEVELGELKESCKRLGLEFHHATGKTKLMSMLQEYTDNPESPHEGVVTAQVMIDRFSK